MKKVVNSIYVHKSNLSELYCNISREEAQAIQPVFTWAFDHDFPYEVVKYDLKKKVVSLINAIGWCEYFEPVVDDSISYNTLNGTFKTRKGGFQVYHMKETFVSEEYTGFWIEEARERTKLLNSLDIIKQNKSRMGSLKWWSEFLEAYNLPILMTKRTDY